MVGQCCGDRAVTLGSPWALSQWLLCGSSAGSLVQQGCACAHTLCSAWAHPPMGALGPSCSSACSAREFGNVTTTLLCVMHLVEQEQWGEILAPSRVCRSSHVTWVGSGLYPSMLLLPSGFPPPYGFIPQLGSSHPIHCNFYSSSKLFCNCYKWKNKR